MKTSHRHRFPPRMWRAPDIIWPMPWHNGRQSKRLKRNHFSFASLLLLLSLSIVLHPLFSILHSHFLSTLLLFPHFPLLVLQWRTLARNMVPHTRREDRKSSLLMWRRQHRQPVCQRCNPSQLQYLDDYCALLFCAPFVSSFYFVVYLFSFNLLFHSPFVYLPLPLQNALPLNSKLTGFFFLLFVASLSCTSQNSFLLPSLSLNYSVVFSCIPRTVFLPVSTIRAAKQGFKNSEFTFMASSLVLPN